MKKNEFYKLEAALIERGYRRDCHQWNHEDYVLAASFHREDNRWDENRAGCQVLLSVYDYTMHPEFGDRLPTGHRDIVGIDVHIFVSRTIDERIELETNWADDMTIEEVECMADSFYRWVLTAYPEPREIKR